MKLAAFLACLAIATLAHAATPAQEKEFADTYRKAYEAKDDKTLTSLLYTKGADPAALSFYKMMMSAQTGGKVTAVELIDVKPEDMKRIESMKSPDGKPAKLVLAPTKKLVVKTKTEDKNGSSTGSSEMFVGEADGKLWILLPAK